VVVIDSVEDERIVPIVESRVRVDSVDRVVVRQAHDIESTYYLLKQFLADEELRGTILVPIGVTLLAFPIISILFGTAIAVATITAVLGAFLLYKGLGVDDYLADLPRQARDAFYSGRVSIVTYVVGIGLALVGVFAGALGVSEAGTTAIFLVVMAFVYNSVPWLALSALSASTGRLFDELIRADELSGAYLNLPFGVVATGIVIRGFSAYFLQRSGVITEFTVPELQAGTLHVSAFPLTAEERLAVFVVVGVMVSLVGVRIASYFSGATLAEPDLHE
jgi:putative membrane protein